MLKEKLRSLNSYGKLSLLIGTIMLIPIVCMIFFPSDFKYIYCFLIPAAICYVAAFLTHKFGKPNDTAHFYTLKQKNSTMIILFAWVFSFLIGALPFWLSGQLNFIRSLFESASGFTATGLSTMDLTAAPKTILFYRSLTQLVGGFGFVILFLVVMNDRQSMELFNAEGHPDKLRPNLQMTSRMIFVIYMAIVGIGTLGCWVLGMSFFDSLNYAMCAVATGGFGTKMDSVAGYSQAVQLWIALLMLLGSVNAVVLMMVQQRRFKEVIKNTELKFTFFLILIFVPICMYAYGVETGVGLWDNFVMSIFNVISAMSTGGFAVSDFVSAPHIVVYCLTILMIFGGGMGSTAGGMKLSRVYIYVRSILKSIKDRLRSSNRVSYLHVTRANGEVVINKKEIESVSNYIGIYIIVYAVGVLALMIASGCQLHESMFEFASCLSTVGLSIGVTSASANVATLLIEIMGMLLGRLEILPIFFAFYYTKEKVKKAFNR